MLQYGHPFVTCKISRNVDRNIAKLLENDACLMFMHFFITLNILVTKREGFLMEHMHIVASVMIIKTDRKTNRDETTGIDFHFLTDE